MEIQGTKPLTVSYGLVDSPIGMLAWLRDKVKHLVDDDCIFDEEELITWTMVCFLSSFRKPSLMPVRFTSSMEQQAMPGSTKMSRQKGWKDFTPIS